MDRKQVPDEILDTLRRLSAVTVERGAFPAEAELAARKLSQLLERYQLSMYDIETDTYNEDIEEVTIEADRQRKASWTHALAGAVSRPYGVYYFLRGARYTKFIGYSSDVQVTTYLYETLSRRLYEDATSEAKKYGRAGGAVIRFRNDYIIAASRVIEERLDREMRSARTDQHTTTQESSRALVVKKDAGITDYVAEKHPGIRIVKTYRDNLDRTAINAGTVRGSNIDLKKGVTNDQKKLLT